MEGKRSFQEETNSTFNEEFWVHHKQKELVRVINQTLEKVSRNLSINHAYFRINAYFKL